MMQTRQIGVKFVPPPNKIGMHLKMPKLMSTQLSLESEHDCALYSDSNHARHLPAAHPPCQQLCRHPGRKAQPNHTQSLRPTAPSARRPT